MIGTLKSQAFEKHQILSDIEPKLSIWKRIYLHLFPIRYRVREEVKRIMNQPRIIEVNQPQGWNLEEMRRLRERHDWDFHSEMMQNPHPPTPEHIRARINDHEHRWNGNMVCEICGFGVREIDRARSNPYYDTRMREPQPEATQFSERGYNVLEPIWTALVSYMQVVKAMVQYSKIYNPNIDPKGIEEYKEILKQDIDAGLGIPIEDLNDNNITPDGLKELMKPKITPKIKTFKLTKLLTLKLEPSYISTSNTPKEYKTIIYVAGEKFNQCKFLLLNLEHGKEYEEIESIDDAAKYLSKDMEGNGAESVGLTPEEEFQGHASNLQAWVENDYNPCILHSNLSFPLLRELIKHKDKKARIAFVEEITYRILNNPFKAYKILKNDFKYFTYEELKVVKDKLKDNKDFIEKMVESFLNNKRNGIRTVDVDW